MNEEPKEIRQINVKEIIQNYNGLIPDTKIPELIPMDAKGPDIDEVYEVTTPLLDDFMTKNTFFKSWDWKVPAVIEGFFNVINNRILQWDAERMFKRLGKEAQEERRLKEIAKIRSLKHSLETFNNGLYANFSQIATKDYYDAIVYNTATMRDDRGIKVREVHSGIRTKKRVDSTDDTI